MTSAAEWYEAYARNVGPASLRIAFQFLDGAIHSVPYPDLAFCWYEVTDIDGGGAITLLSGGRPGGVEVVITGRHLGGLFADLGDRRVAWIRELPRGGTVVAAGTPIVFSIEVREAAIGRPPARRA